jgi:hypothetical protein
MVKGLVGGVAPVGRLPDRRRIGIVAERVEKGCQGTCCHVWADAIRDSAAVKSR